MIYRPHLRTKLDRDATPEQRRDAHKAKMAWKADNRVQYHAALKSRRPVGFIPASINRHTGKPHEHRREIARRLTA